MVELALSYAGTRLEPAMCSLQHSPASRGWSEALAVDESHLSEDRYSDQNPRCRVSEAGVGLEGLHQQAARVNRETRVWLPGRSRS